MKENRQGCLSRIIRPDFELSLKVRNPVRLAKTHFRQPNSTEELGAVQKSQIDYSTVRSKRKVKVSSLNCMASASFGPQLLEPTPLIL